MRDAAEWDARYAQGQVWSTEPNRFLVDAVRAHGLDRPAAGARAVDLGCGEGRNTVWLASLGWDVTGVDMSSVGIDRARALADQQGVRVNYVVDDLERWDAGEPAWDLVAMIYVHWPAAQRWQLLQRFVDALAPGGHFIVVAHDRTNIEHGHGGPQNPDVLATPAELADFFRNAGLTVLAAHEVLRPVTLEPGHGGAPTDGVTTVDAIDHVVVARRAG
jgi:2-polyprenyl-3-methyl-5-hydroxy-6-metoxy-1,4-benzoquinol methylase